MLLNSFLLSLNAVTSIFVMMAVTMTTLLSSGTMFFWIFLFMPLGMF